MAKGKPIFESYINLDGTLIETDGFLNFERVFLMSKGWVYDSKQGAWMPPH